MQPVQSSPVNLYNNNNNSNVVSNPWSYPQTQQQSQQQPTTADPFGSLLWKKMMHFSCFAQHNFPLIFLFHNFLRPKKRCFHYLLCLLDWVLHPAQILGPTTYCCYNEPYFHVGYITKIESVASHNTTNCALPAQRSTFFKK